MCLAVSPSEEKERNGAEEKKNTKVNTTYYQDGTNSLKTRTTLDLPLIVPLQKKSLKYIILLSPTK